MSEQCTCCGSFDTETAYGNYLGRGLLHAGRFVLAAGAACTVGIVSKAAGVAAGAAVMRGTKPSDSFKGNYCNRCHKYFE